MNQRRSKSKLSLDKAVSDGCVHTERKVFPFHLKERSEERKNKKQKKEKLPPNLI